MLQSILGNYVIPTFTKTYKTNILCHVEYLSTYFYLNLMSYFSYIVGFTNLSASSTAMEIIAMLNDLYTMFDVTTEKHEVIYFIPN